ncbi:serine protease hepsin-like [Clytia hemisphaerica]
MKPEDWHVYAGDHELRTKDLFEQQVKVKRVFFHDEYFLYLHQHRKGSWVTADNDIAIMELAQPIDLQHEHRGQVCLPDNKQPTRDGQYCHVIGWGHTSYKGKQPDHLMHAVVMTIPNKICNLEMAYNGTVKEKYLLCAGYKEGGIDACNYDSGGAMVCHTNGRWYAQGIVSSGFECATPNAYGLYTRVSQDKEWIIETLLKSAAPKPIY